LAAKRSSCSASTPTPIVSAVLPTAPAAEIERSISVPRPPTVVTPDQHATERANACAQQFRLTAEALQPTRGAFARGLDALQALLAALTDRDQLGLELAAALDREADRVGVTSECHRSGPHPLAQAYHPGN
jgi:hypothetical protein